MNLDFCTEFSISLAAEKKKNLKHRILNWIEDAAFPLPHFQKSI